jgi:hypothetical protein
MEKFDFIFSQRHPKLREKEDVYKLIYDSYLGGTRYKQGNYLKKYPKESVRSFDARKSRAIYFNQLSPIVDMLSGLLFANEPIRTLPSKIQPVLNTIGGSKKINEFMRTVEAYSFMFTIGILVDVKSYDSSIVRTKRDRKELGIEPYAIIYMPHDIVDFDVNFSDGDLNWVLLDNSYRDHSDPYKPAIDVKIRRLWTREFYQDFVWDGKSVSFGEQIPHNLGVVPFRMHSWRDDDDDMIGETPCEDIAYISRLIYNSMSYMDEMLASGTFKMLTYPSVDGKVPKNLETGGVGALSVIPYQVDSSTTPGFIGASLNDIDPFIKAMEFYMAEILKKVGMSTDETKEFVKSGKAKKIDLEKMRALLISGASKAGRLEEWIFKIAGKWQGEDIDANIEYNSSYSNEDLETEIDMLTGLLVHPIKTLRVNVLNLLVKKLLASNLPQSELESIYKEIKNKITEDTMGITGTPTIVSKNQNISDGEQNE